MSPRLFADAVVRLLLLPPTNLLVLFAAGCLLRRRRPRAGRAIATVAVILLLVLSSGLGSMLLVRPLEDLAPPLAGPGAHGAQAIVVLGAGSIYRSPEYGGLDIPDEVALVRLRYGAHLQHATGLPLLVTGGNGTPDGALQAKGLGMAQALREDFRTPVRWVETESADTRENALFSARILRAEGVTRILLVTHAMHMPRAVAAFERAGLQVVPAPTAFYSRGHQSMLGWLPSAAGMDRSYYATHEWIGLLWYRLRAALRTDGTENLSR
jgi:uncharacterized SAM-binding protein YcdF (DUF218 family)